MFRFLIGLSCIFMDLSCLNAKPSPTAVIVKPVEKVSFTFVKNFTGTTEAKESVEIQSRVTGHLKKVFFQEGTDVQKGQKLFQIENKLYKARYQEAQGNVSRLKTQLKEADRKLVRAQRLSDKGFGADKHVDDTLAQRDSLIAKIMMAEAKREQALINLNYTTLSSLIAGRIGLSHFSKGDLITPNSGVMATVLTLDPIRVVFSVTEQEREKLKSLDSIVLKPAQDDTDGRPGKIDFMDNKVDPKTGTIAVRALFPNADKRFLPGQFVTVHLYFSNPAEGLAIPQTGLQQDKSGHFVYIVNGNAQVEKKPVEVSHQFQSKWILKKGVALGEKVIIEGGQKVRPGDKVKIIKG